MQTSDKIRNSAAFGDAHEVFADKAVKAAIDAVIHALYDSRGMKAPMQMSRSIAHLIEVKLHREIKNLLDEVEYWTPGGRMATGDKAEYQAYFKKKMEEHGLTGLEGVGEEKLKKFMEDVDRGWKADKESSVVDRLNHLAARIRRIEK